MNGRKLSPCKRADSRKSNENWIKTFSFVYFEINTEEKNVSRETENHGMWSLALSNLDNQREEQKNPESQIVHRPKAIIARVWVIDDAQFLILHKCH